MNLATRTQLSATHMCKHQAQISPVNRALTPCTENPRAYSFEQSLHVFADLEDETDEELDAVQLVATTLATRLNGSNSLSDSAQ